MGVFWKIVFYWILIQRSGFLRGILSICEKISLFLDLGWQYDGCNPIWGNPRPFKWTFYWKNRMGKIFELKFCYWISNFGPGFVLSPDRIPICWFGNPIRVNPRLSRKFWTISTFVALLKNKLQFLNIWTLVLGSLEKIFIFFKSLDGMRIWYADQIRGEPLKTFLKISLFIGF